MPLLDGGARSFVDALRRVGAPSGERGAMRIVRAGTIDVGRSRYELTPSTSSRIDVSLSFDELGRTSEASWDGSVNSFLRDIAPARTFGLAHEVMELVERGLAAHVAPESVVVLGRSDVLWAGRPFTDSEPARHKLLDLVGDLFLHGGPPARGIVHATRPGHAATHAAIREAVARGLVTVSA
jgi:UDP-3-O-[3-hydroxymyristoyl] N-acetylglucosamine deacetylase